MGLLVDYKATAPPNLSIPLKKVKNSYVSRVFDFSGDSPCSENAFISVEVGIT